MIYGHAVHRNRRDISYVRSEIGDSRQPIGFDIGIWSCYTLIKYAY